MDFDFVWAPDGLCKYQILTQSPEQVSKHLLTVSSALSEVTSAFGMPTVLTLVLVAVELYLVDCPGDLEHFIGHLSKAIIYATGTLLCMVISAMMLVTAVAKPMVRPSHLGLRNSKAQRRHVVSAALQSFPQAG